MTPAARARDALTAASAHGWTGPVQIREYAAQCLIGNGVEPQQAREIVAQEWETMKHD